MDFKKFKCPKCGEEYLPSEVFFPEDFLGTGHDIIRNENGQIEHFLGDDMNLVEEFTCEKCNCTFKVAANIAFTTEVVPAHDFSEDYKTVIYSGDRVELKEE